MKPLSRSSGRGPTACSVGSLIAIAAIVFLSSFAQAAYLINVPQTLRQPDGEILRCLASGDEYFNWLHDAAGYTIIQDPRTGYYVYAEPAPGGEIRASGLIAGRINPAAAGLARGVQPAASSRSRLIAAARRRQAAADPTPAPKTGTINNLVVFIRFQGESEFTDAPSVFTQMLNGAGAADNSMLGYFREASYNRLTVQSTLYPTPGATVLSYLDANARGYYQPYNAVSNPTGYTGGDNGADRMNREHTLLKNAVSAVAAQVPAGLIVDGDGDGLVDNIVFVVSGSPTGWASLLWPHQWALYSQYAYINGKRVYTYNLQLRTTTGTGVLCHEMCHSIGLPDLYHYSDNGIDPVGRWDVMEWDANPPQHMGAFMKWRYTGWIASLPEITAAGTYTLSPLTTSTGNCYKIRSPNSATEYFVLEYRRRTGTFEASLPGDGLLVYRINSARDGQGNASGPPDEVYIYRPDGTTSANGLVNSAAYSSAAGRTTINDTTNPSSFLSSGGAGGLRILNVGSAGSTISFDVRFPTALNLSRNKLSFGAVAGAAGTKAQTVTVSISGAGAFNWSASSGQSWITVAPASGSGVGSLAVSVNPAGLAPGSYSGSIAVMSAEASNSPQNVAVSLTVYSAGASASPFGSFDTPTDSSTVRSSIAVTGWALDDVETTTVKIYRAPVGAEPAEQHVYIGDATFVEGARPDVETAYPNHPLNTRAGWGYMLLTNFLPVGGNGAITLYAEATDREGHTVTLGSKSITCDNAHAVKPFGAIDTPTQGGEASGSGYYNFAWALTPLPNSIPTDGSTMWVWVDGVPLGHPSYNHYRSDIAAAFPGYANSNGAVGVFTLNTTGFTNGVHTIAWSVRDNAGNEDGIGSRFFSILKTGSPEGVRSQHSTLGLPSVAAAGSGVRGSNTVGLGGRHTGTFTRVDELGSFRDVSSLPSYARKGFDRSLPPDRLSFVIPSSSEGSRKVIPSLTVIPRLDVIPSLREGPLLQIRELERLEILLDDRAWSADAERRALARAGLAQVSSRALARDLSASSPLTLRWAGFLIVGDELRPLPIGSTLDSGAGIFSWLPGPGFLGDYRLVFIDHENKSKAFLTIRIEGSGLNFGRF